MIYFAEVFVYFNHFFDIIVLKTEKDKKKKSILFCFFF